jgi:hypothetical protein
MAKSLGSPFWLLVVWLAVGAMSLIGALCFGELDQIIAYFFFVVLLFLGLTVAGLAVIRRHPGRAAATILTPGYPATPVEFLALVAVMLVLLAASNPRRALLGCVVVAAGWPVYSWIRK